MRDVRLYFDFISPYSWLALMAAGDFAREHGVRWRVRPVVYGKLLDETGLVGPAEVSSKRRYTFRDIVRCAHRMGVAIQGPPEHPFRSLEALRTVCLFRSEPVALDLCVALADATWGQGRDLTEIRVLEEVVAAVGLDARELGVRIGSPAVKRHLHDLTREALDLGVFGVPTFVYEGELFWGHDRLPHLADRLEGRLVSPPDDAEALLRRPRGIDRARSPMRKPGDS